MQVKNFFQSKTIQSACLGLAIACWPIFNDAFNDGRFPNKVELFQLMSIAGTTALTMYGRYVADGVLFTPQGLPGRNKEQILDALLKATTEEQSTENS